MTAPAPQDAAHQQELRDHLAVTLARIAHQTGSRDVATLAGRITTESHGFQAECDLTLTNQLQTRRIGPANATFGTLAQTRQEQARRFDALAQSQWHTRMFRLLPETELLSSDRCDTCNGKARVTCPTCKGGGKTPCTSYSCH